jgi:death-on-curing protein
VIEPEFLTLTDVLLMHNDQIRLYGGNIDLHDLALLESAIAQPQAKFGDQWLHPDLYFMAAAYTFHIVKNHPFVDGNKRTGLNAAAMFLRLNGKQIRGSVDSLIEATWRLSETQMTKEEYAEILKQVFG